MEKRKFSRVTFSLKAFVNSRNISIKGDVENLSLKGAFIRTDTKLEPGLPVEVTLYLPGTTNPLDISVNITGTVLRVEETGLVLQFREMDVDSFTLLKNIVAYNAGDEDQVMDELLGRDRT
ncbi:PilZ domain-containing protein [Geobacter sp. DSM 9736]|uniref:PilZ domain-containing protein n=1 Tax=Geobacter sp. DSM 9736 TaxID=1277350 RepID=UPI000B5088B0|nr:PilZ domain-containing protein [Geobacter sp. DSM 9736]SNB47613.1 PilZ domain-containing protein [Geobacter sp. DSM 9736]